MLPQGVSTLRHFHFGKILDLFLGGNLLFVSTVVMEYLPGPFVQYVHSYIVSRQSVHWYKAKFCNGQLIIDRKVREISLLVSVCPSVNAITIEPFDL